VLTHLSLTHFRNYRRLELDFSGPLTLLQGQNAQGKTNLLEAIFVLATSKPVHAQSEREIVGWQASEEPLPFARVAGQAQLEGRSSLLEVIFTPRADGVNFTKQVKINGAARRSMDLIGLLRAVLFLPEDIKLVDAAPSERRRYLDIALCQIDRVYYRALADYQQVLTQRNSLLKNLREQEANPHAPLVETQLLFWDEKLVAAGAELMSRRHNFLQLLEPLARQRHAELSQGREALALQYVPGLNTGLYSEEEYRRLQDGLLPAAASPLLDPVAVAALYLRKLHQRRAAEVGAGNTLYGPHRDDVRFLANGRDLRPFGSRGQQRSAALSLKLAEVRAMTDVTGQAPLLLLDDVMSELDAVRRGMLLQVLDDVPQAILTTTDWEDFTPTFRAQAQRLQVQSGDVCAPAE
jgi:DNA replication and repair protein RecF